MSSTAEATKRSDVSLLFVKFANICPEKATAHVIGMRTILEDPEKIIQKPWDIYPLYINAMRIARVLVDAENPKLKSRFLKILDAFNNAIVCRENAPDILFDFSPIIDMVQRNNIELPCTTEILDSQDDQKVQEAAKALESLTQEGIGINPGILFFTKRLKSKDAWSVIVRNEQNNIVGFVLGTNLHLADNTTTFHFNFFVRSPKYPLINFTQMMQNRLKDLTERYQPDFLSLCVDLVNPVKKIYQDYGFEQVSSAYNPSINGETAFMVKRVNRDKEAPTYDNVRAALTSIRLKEQE